MDVRLASSDEEIQACYAVMRELRPDIREQDFLSRVRSQERAGYRLVCLREAGTPVAVAGFRTGETLAWGRHVYVDDLVTLPTHRSRGIGAALLSWIFDFAAAQGCAEVRLDSGVQRTGAHRFYEREGMEMVSLHFRKDLKPRSS